VSDIYVSLETVRTEVVGLQQAYTEVVTLGGQGPQGGLFSIRAKSVAFADPLTLDWSDAETIDLTLTDNVSALTMTGASDGQRCTLRVKQGGTGSYTISLPPNVRMNDDIPALSLSTAVGKLDFVGFQYHGADAKYDLVATTKGAA
jgi:hypothetical protein